jgi:hypothetical protein
MDYDHGGQYHPLTSPGPGKESEARRGIDRAKAEYARRWEWLPMPPLEVAGAEGKLPENKVNVTRDKIVALGLQRSAEMVEASRRSPR